jgi:hypothetical protein
MLAHLRSLVLAQAGRGEDRLPFWDGRPLTRICQGIPEDIAMLLGPVHRILTQDEGDEWVCIDRGGDAFMTEHIGRDGPAQPLVRLHRPPRPPFPRQAAGIVARNITNPVP